MINDLISLDAAGFFYTLSGSLCNPLLGITYEMNLIHLYIYRMIDELCDESCSVAN